MKHSKSPVTHWFYRLISISTVVFFIACAPITPLPGPTLPSPSIPSSGGLPSGGLPSPAPSTPAPSGGPPSSPSSSPGSPSSSPPSSPSGSPSGGSPGSPGKPASYPSLPGGGAPTLPSSKPGESGSSDQQTSPGGALPGESDAQTEKDEGWESADGGAEGGEGEDGGSEGQGEWETSNELPSTAGAGSGGDGTSESAAGGEDDSLPGSGGEAGTAEGELDKALEDFDGEILSERGTIRTRTNEQADGSAGGLPEGDSQDGGSAETSATAGGTDSAPHIPRARTTPPGPRGSGGGAPDDIPDARDDDIIARQLREAAMNETDPVLKEKLWQEYRRYKDT